MVCSQCFHEWDPADVSADSDDKVFDSNGNELQDGDSVVVIKDLPVKGAPKPVKAGTKVKISDLDREVIITSIVKSTDSDRWL